MGERETLTGAVMVVGGGIAGMQASLDLAEQGFRVYLVEHKSAIGGHMAQLDKTFPTNDCAMCTISPRLVDVGRHINIELMTMSEVVSLSGAPGDFSVRVRRKPRYVDASKCVGCGDCATACPIVRPAEFEEKLSTRRAAFRLYPQATPVTYAIEKLGKAPCRDACPTGQRAQGYVALVREGRYAEALRVIREDNPFPGICGRICNHRCEIACNRGLVDEPLNIHGIKRFVADWAYSQPRVAPARVPHSQAERVAVIGGGPCGLTAARDLAMVGFPVTVFEALPVAGGMLRVGVPEYRLPAAIVDREVQDIIDLGIDLRLNTRVDDLDGLFEQGYSAVLISVGAHEGKKLRIPGADLPGVLVNTSFLRDVRLDAAADLAGHRVLVIGGGNVAIDCARTAVRLGAAHVTMACLESRETMPAHSYEVEEAEAEGVEVVPSRTFLRILGEQQVAGVECQRVTRFQFDSEGQLVLETEPGSEHVLECDTVIFSIGQRAGLAFIPPDTGVGVTRQGTIAVNPNTFAATRPGVFAAGDATTGTAFVVEAVAAGHQAAKSIHRFLRGEELEPRFAPDLPVVRLESDEARGRVARGEASAAKRTAMPQVPLERRRGTFMEVEAGYGEADARREAERCLQCGICSECLSCVAACQANAIDHDQVEREEEIRVGAIVLAPGYEVFDAERAQEFGFGRNRNVVNALQFERLLSASGPTQGHVERPSDHRPAKKIAFLQCVGSRDQAHDYCSAVCCMYASKQAIMAKEHDAETEATIFLMDMRAFSKGYEEYYQRAQSRYGVRFVRTRISAVREEPGTQNLKLQYWDPEQAHAVEESFDLVVLSVGMETSSEVRALAGRLGVELDQFGFCHTEYFAPLESSRAGVFVAGPFSGPKDIPETVVQASGAAALAGQLLAPARGVLARTREYPPEREVGGEAPRIGVFVCHCGSNIAGYLDVEAVTRFAEQLPGVVHAERNLYTCSQDSVATIIQRIGEQRLNRVVVASCTPRTHEPLFQDALRQAGLNPFLFEMANIRNQCSWVHSNDRDGATAKAQRVVRMSVARAGGLEPLVRTGVAVEHGALVVGGGPAGMSAALVLAEQGFAVHLVERENELGGNLRNLRFLAGGSAPQELLRDLVVRVERQPRIVCHMHAAVAETQGVVGNFVSRIQHGDGSLVEIHHGASIIATGGQEARGEYHGLGLHPRVITQQEFEQRLWDEEGGRISARGLNLGNRPARVIMLQCVGADGFCGRICCGEALKTATALKRVDPSAQVRILFRDLRAFGTREGEYTEARRAGVEFVRYEAANPPYVDCGGDLPKVTVEDASLRQGLSFSADWLVLSTPMIAAEGAHELAQVFRVPRDAQGYFLEAHVKLRPLDFASEGVFMAGAAHYPKFLDEAIAQGQAAASRAANILARDTLPAGGAVANVDSALCTGCLTCVRVCPMHVPAIRVDFSGVGGIVGAAYIDPVACQGCGQCVGECPAHAIVLMHNRSEQIRSKIAALFEEAGAWAS